jgi:hypothetical protein
MSVNSTAFMFRALREDQKNPMPKEACAALVTTTQALDEEGRIGLQMLDHISTVIDVSKPTAVDLLRKVTSRADLTA